jgi:anti-sigma B factor antagonist
MAAVGPSFFTVPDRPTSRLVGSEIGPIVVWLWGEHDVSTDTALCLTLARAIAVGRAGVIVDLSGVEFMGASTLGVIARARELLRQGSASLTVRSPSAFVRRVIGVCGLDDLLGAGPEKAADVTGEALGSRVALPAAHWPNRRPGRERRQTGGDRMTKVAPEGGGAHREGRINQQSWTPTEKEKDDL